MYIYNVTTNIERSIAQEWLQWVQRKQIPAMLATGKFLEAKLSQVMVEEAQGITYSIQYTAESKEMLELYLKEDEMALQKEEMQLFRAQLVSFKTELKVIHHINNL